MDAVTYPQEKVADFIMGNIVPLKIPADEQPLASDYDVTWTPALLIIDSVGKEYHRTVGFLAAGELIPAMLLGMGKTYFTKNDFGKALENLEKVVKNYADSDSAPEAIFLAGVCTYKSSNDPMPLKRAYEELVEKYPDNLWTKRAYPYRLIG